jgi:hypothetical protein
MTTREAALAALFGRLQTISCIPPPVTFGRRVRLAADLPPEQQPALFQIVRRETYTGGERAGLRKLTQEVALIFYFRADGGQVGDAIINAFLDGLDQLLAGDDPGTGNLTLGGLVQRVWIDGEAFRDSGDLDNQGLVIVPLKLQFP